MGRVCSTCGQKMNTYRVEKSDVNRPVRRHRCRWKDTIKIDFREIGWGSTDCRSQWPRGLRSLKHWDHGFESHFKACLSAFILCLCW
jgi:hypothetical protein